MKHTLIVGEQGVGKSTLIERVLRELSCTYVGFRTKKGAEENGVFPLFFYPIGEGSGKAERLGKICFPPDAAMTDAFSERADFVQGLARQGRLVLMDELGVLETGSEAFCRAVLSVFDGNAPILAAVKQKSHPFLEQIRTHPQSQCFFITEENRDSLFCEVLGFVRAQLNFIP